MAHFHRVPGGQRVSGTTVVVDGDTLTIGLWGARDFSGKDLILTSDGNDLSFFPAGTSGDSALFKVRVNQQARTTRKGLTDTVYAVTDRLEAWDKFQVEFRFASAPSADLLVRDVTQQAYGLAQLEYSMASSSAVNMATFKPGDPANVLGFMPEAGRPVRLRLYAAKLGTVERCYWLMLPLHGPASSLMVVISHGFGQQDAFYSKLGYSDPFSKPFLEDIKLRFVMGRWGAQVAGARAGMALLMPMRARNGTGKGTELGPFISQAGVGARIIGKIAALADAAPMLNSVGVVTFSSGISDANTFLAAGGKGLAFKLGVNQDPAHGAPLNVPGLRKQYLSGYTTGGPRPGFEYMPKPRWANDPEHTRMTAALGGQYLHTWALPQYTLGMALR